MLNQIRFCLGSNARHSVRSAIHYPPSVGRLWGIHARNLRKASSSAASQPVYVITFLFSRLTPEIVVEIIRKKYLGLSTPPTSILIVNKLRTQPVILAIDAFLECAIIFPSIGILLPTVS